MCDHRVSYDDEEGAFIKRSEIVDFIKFEIKAFNNTKKSMLRTAKISNKALVGHYSRDYKPSDFLDPKLFTTVPLFNYCPRCGRVIDWKSIKQELDSDKI